MKPLPLVIALCVLPQLAPIALPQDRGADRDRYQERERFPVVRNVFRQIRGDIRYHVGALRETASGIGHDVKSTFRGERPPRGAAQNQYGYRSVPVPPREYSPTGNRTDEYEEPSPPRYPAGPRQPTPEHTGPRVVPAETHPRPEPATSSTGTDRSQADDPLNEVPELERLPDTGPASKPAPAPTGSPQPQRQSNPRSESEAKPKPVIGKVEYPEAKRSDRPGFHYSPYAPYELLDTQGIEPGGLAKDPGNGNIFRLPK